MPTASWHAAPSHDHDLMALAATSSCTVLLQTPAFTTRKPETRRPQMHSILSVAAINAVDLEPMLRPVVRAALLPGVWMREVSFDRLRYRAAAACMHGCLTHPHTNSLFSGHHRGKQVLWCPTLH